MKKLTLALLFLTLMAFTGCGTDSVLGPDTAAFNAQDDDTVGEIKDEGKKKDRPEEDDSGGEEARKDRDGSRDLDDVIDGNSEIPGGGMSGGGVVDPGHGDDVEDGN